MKENKIFGISPAITKWVSKGDELFLGISLLPCPNGYEEERKI
jgi:hypothetical protein